MSGMVLVIFYGSILFCLIACVTKIVKCVRAPLHLRWELYRRDSVYQNIGEWCESGLTFKDKLKAAAQDILLLRGYYRQKRRFWYFLYLFHGGLYLLVLWHVILFIVPLTVGVGAAHASTIVLGHVSTGMIFFGALGIFISRAANKELKAYYSAAHYFKLIWLMVTLLGGFYAVYFYFGNGIYEVLRYVEGQLVFDLAHKLNPPLVTSLHVLFVSSWLVYLPFSHMMRLFFRYYHELRWDYVLNHRRGGIEKRVRKLFNHQVSWAAPHIPPGKTWKELAETVSGSGR